MFSFSLAHETGQEFALRSMRVEDLPALLAIDEACFDDGWNEQEFRQCMRRQHVSGYIAELNGRPAGYVIYEVSSYGYELVSIAVHPDVRFRGFGKAMLSFVSIRARGNMWCIVRESNLNAHLFLKSCGMIATGIIWGCYETEDGYRFEEPI